MQESQIDRISGGGGHLLTSNSRHFRLIPPFEEKYAE